MKSKLAFFISKLAHTVLSKRGGGGSLPGKLAMKIDKDILLKLKYPKEVIFVTATNGKTSTSNMIAQILNLSGRKVISNTKGDNLLNGIASLLVTNANSKLEVQADSVVIEVDELTLGAYRHLIPASHIVVNNFFRDQLDRSGEMESLIKKIESALVDFDKTLVLNHDDPNVLRLKYKAPKAKVLTFHFEENEYSTKENKEASEGKFCPACYEKLTYEYYHYSHIGKFYCPNCEFAHVEPDFVATLVDTKTGEFNWKGNSIISSNPSLYHLYNCLSALTICTDLGVDIETIKQGVKDFQIFLGRNEMISITGRDCLLNLVKNPTGMNEVLKMINQDSSEKIILFAFNDNGQDSSDVSWIWDVDFQNLKGVKKIFITGLRPYEIALRIQNDGLDWDINVIENQTEAIKAFLDQEGSLYALATYTALAPLRKELVSWN